MGKKMTKLITSCRDWEVLSEPCNITLPRSVIPSEKLEDLVSLPTLSGMAGKGEKGHHDRLKYQG